MFPGKVKYADPSDQAFLAWVCGRSLAGIAVSNPAGDMNVYLFLCCVLSGRGLCNGPIARS